MARELSNVEKLLSGILQDVNKATEKRERKTPRKAISPNKAPSKARDKENPAPKKPPGRKSAKEPLQPSNTDRRTPKKVKEGVSTAKRGRQATPSPSKDKKQRKEVPKIVVYEDQEGGQRGGRPKGGRKDGRQLSRSWEGRRSGPEGRRSPRMSAGPKRNRHSFNDLCSLRSPGGKERGRASKSGNVRAEDPQLGEMLGKLEMLFPGVDPEFLKGQLVKHKGSLSETIEVVIVKEKTDELPTRADYMKRRETEKLEKKFMESFSVEGFLKMIPDPWGHFVKPEGRDSARYAGHSLHYLKNKFKYHCIQTIQEALAKNQHSLYLTHKELSKKNKVHKMRATSRSKSECGAGKPLNFDVEFVHEVAFVENEAKIKAHMKKAEAEKQKRFRKAEEEGALVECQSCNESKLLPEEAVSCPANHNFCKDCVVKYVETEVDKNNFQFKCLIKCQEKFPLDALKDLLSPGLVAEIINRNRLEEIKSAGIDHLVHCPFCYCVGVIPPELTVLKCLNPSCLAESCRHCKQPNHIPLPCHRPERLDSTLTEGSAPASPPRCIRCNKDFLKKEDSHKMDCPCGATMCSVCRRPFPECAHFNEPERRLSRRLSSCSEDTEAEEDCSENADSSTDNVQLIPSGSESF